MLSSINKKDGQYKIQINGVDMKVKSSSGRKSSKASDKGNYPPTCDKNLLENHSVRS